jgi:SAM-dependent methyltransferase
MIKITRILGWKYDTRHKWIIDNVERRKHNDGYNASFPMWWGKFPLRGTGYVIGEQHPQGRLIETQLRLQGHKIISLKSVDLYNADVQMNIVKYLLPKQVNFILCMAVLEHVYDPPQAFRNLSKALVSDGYLYISVPVNGFKQHRAPIDCYRFMEDALFGFAEMGNIRLLDYSHSNSEWCAVYKK